MTRPSRRVLGYALAGAGLVVAAAICASVMWYVFKATSSFASAPHRRIGGAPGRAANATHPSRVVTRSQRQPAPRRY